MPKRPDRILAGIARGTALPLTPPRGIEGTNGTLSKVELYGEDPRAGTRVQAALALLDQGFRRLVAGRHEEAVDAFDEVMVRYLNDDDPAVRHEAAPALLGEAMALRQLGCSEEAISLCEAAVAANGTAAEPHLRDVAVSALDLQIDLLYELGRAEAASEAYAQLAVRFAEDPEPAIREVVVRAVHKQTARSSSGDGGSPGAADQGAGRGPRRRPALWRRHR